MIPSSEVSSAAIRRDAPWQIHAKTDAGVITIGMVVPDALGLRTFVRRAVLDPQHAEAIWRVFEGATEHQGKETWQEQAERLLTFLERMTGGYVLANLAFQLVRKAEPIHDFIEHALTIVRFCRGCDGLFLRERRKQVTCDSTCQTMLTKIRERRRDRAPYNAARRREKPRRELLTALLRDDRSKNSVDIATLTAMVANDDPRVIGIASVLENKNPSIARALIQYERTGRRRVTARSARKRLE